MQKLLIEYQAYSIFTLGLEDIPAGGKSMYSICPYMSSQSKILLVIQLYKRNYLFEGGLIFFLHKQLRRMRESVGEQVRDRERERQKGRKVSNKALYASKTFFELQILMGSVQKRKKNSILCGFVVVMRRKVKTFGSGKYLWGAKENLLISSFAVLILISKKIEEGEEGKQKRRSLEAYFGPSLIISNNKNRDLEQKTSQQM